MRVPFSEFRGVDATRCYFIWEHPFSVMDTDEVPFFPSSSSSSPNSPAIPANGQSRSVNSVEKLAMDGAEEEGDFAGENAKTPVQADLDQSINQSFEFPEPRTAKRKREEIIDTEDEFDENAVKQKKTSLEVPVGVISEESVTRLSDQDGPILPSTTTTPMAAAVGGGDVSFEFPIASAPISMDISSSEEQSEGTESSAESEIAEEAPMTVEAKEERLLERYRGLMSQQKILFMSGDGAVEFADLEMRFEGLLMDIPHISGQLND